MILSDEASPAGLSAGLEALGREAHDIEVRHAKGSLQQQLFGVAGPQTIERYVVLRKLGAGGMGIVYAAYDPQLEREVAIKVLRSSDARRLMREAEALAKLTHPNVVQVFAIGLDEERPFIVMELVAGVPLDRWEDDEHGTREIIELYHHVGEGLAAAHAAGIVHRDFKPQNVLVGNDGRPRVLDFGLARGTEDIALLTTVPSGADSLPTAIGRPITRRGAVLGTVAYMAPEQFRGEEVNALADQYAFCLSLWRAVYGEHAFPTDSLGRMMTAREAGELAVPPIGTRVPRWLRLVLARGLAPRPADRFPDMRTLLDALRRGRERGRRRIVAGVGVLGAAVVAALVLATPGAAKTCTADLEALQGAWDPARRDEVLASVGATDVPQAADLASTIAQRLDDYAERWRAAWTEACEATRVRGEQSEAVLDQRMACLQRRRVELHALTAVLVTGDEIVAANATSAIADLPDPAACEQAVASSIDPALAPELEAIRAELASVTALKDTGKHDEAIAAGEPLISRAQRSGAPQILAEVSFTIAEVQHRLGREPEANANYREAYLSATESGDDALAVASATALLETLVIDPEPREEAERWRRIAESAAARLPDPQAVRDELLMRYGRIVSQTGGLAEGVAALEEAVALRKKRLGPEDPSLRFTLSYLAMMMMDSGDPEGAQPIHAEAIAIAEKALGRQHTDLARLLSNAAGADAMAGDLLAAKAKLERALTIYEVGASGHAYDIGTTEMNLAITYAYLKDGQQALEHARRGVEVLQVFPDDPKFGGALAMLAELESDYATNEEAMVTMERALVAIGNAVNDRTCETHAAAAELLQKIGEAKRSEMQIEEAERCDDLGPSHQIALASLWCRSTQPTRATPYIAALQRDPAALAEFERLFPRCMQWAP